MGLRPHLSFCTCKTVRLAPELLVSMGPCPHLWFLQAKRGLLDQNYKSLFVSELTCRFIHVKQRDLLQHNKSIWVPALICGFGCKTATLGTELQVSVGPRPHLWLFHAKE